VWANTYGFDFGDKPRQMKPDIEYPLNIARRYLAKPLIFLALPTELCR
jgi:hypothetical protein